MAWYNWFQRTADKIKAWDVSPATKEKIAELNKKIPGWISAALMTLVMNMYKRYNKEFVTEQLGNIKEFIETLDKD